MRCQLGMRICGSPNSTLLFLSGLLNLSLLGATATSQSLDALARPQAGRSMRSTSTAVDEHGDYAPSNNDNSRVAPGATKVVLDAEGPGTVTHLWFTFLGPERHPWAPRDRPIIRKCCCGSTTTAKLDPPWKSPWGISLPTVSAGDRR